jgi:hypothetical protein
MKPTAPTSGGGARSGAQVETWSTGKKLSGIVEVPLGTTVEIASGASIGCAQDAKVVVRGILRVKAGSNPAKISCNTWAGIQVADAGVLAADGLELENADVAISTVGDGSEATIEHGSIKGSITPFSVGVATKLSLISTKVTAKGQSEVLGDLYASRLTYDKGAGEGIIMGHPNATVVVEDSVLTGTGNGELIDSAKGALVKVSYSTLTGSHCAFHFDSIKRFEIDHVTTDASLFSVMFYGSEQGGKVSYSNLVGTSVDVDIQNANGKIELDHVYTLGREQVKGTAPVITNRRTAAVPDAKPR